MNAVADAPLFRDPVYDGAADPVAVHHRQSGEWWLVYTNRRTTAPGPGVAWVHGTDLGVAASADGGRTWTYRGTLTGLDTEWGRNTFWAPEIIWHDGLYHMYVSYIRGVPDSWDGAARIRHYTSPDMLEWNYHGVLDLDSDRVIDACVFPLPGGGWRMWFKDESRGSLTCAADSPDLYHWRPIGVVVDHRGHEGPNVFALDGHYWMIIDEWRGQGVLRSDDLTTWEHQGLILDTPGSRPDDGNIGLHADVVVQGETAYIFYFTHPGRPAYTNDDDGTQATRRSSLQVAAARVVDGRLHCDRDEPVRLDLTPMSQ
ncbi:Glycosyl hydrolase family 32 domain protein [Streptomyces bingchenggensis BCW-1]|uniref:Glycosyl hydrolase family 32 domain protein n=1 Tax=Streptomyces bingchenggensis (strain BCW-1) TaxID=749414 RepID=D7CF49_STRBB|nr:MULTISPECIES: family 43 glycosylhydrolase [Streptomyces]ADI13065.1 Glycosyl hydrolase family 32 domain protein [Streptomyces bingchenggensis BCW-1]